MSDQEKEGDLARSAPSESQARATDVAARRPRLTRLGALLILVAIVAAGLFLRARDLDLYRLGPDDGSYLYSAEVHTLDRDASVPAMLAEDRAWLAEYPYYPHSRLHQLMVRWWYRLGAGAVEAVRLNSAVLGALSAGLIGLFYLIFRPRRLGAGLFAAVIVATQAIFVWYGRSGWGQPACTFAWLVYAGLGWRLLADERSGLKSRLQCRLQRWLLGLGLCLSSLAAFHLHEMAVVHVVGMILVAAVWPLASSAGTATQRLRAWPAAVVRSRELRVVVLSSIPVLALLAQLATDDFAQRHWLDVAPEDRPGFWDIKAQNLRFLFGLTRVQHQLSYLVLLLAAGGAVVLARRDRPLWWYVMLQLGVCTIPFLLFFKDASLVRIYLPSFALCALLAGEAVDGVAAMLGRPGGRLLLFGAAAVAGGWMTLTSWRTVFGEPGQPGFIRWFHAPAGFDIRPPHDPYAPLFSLLKDELDPGETVAVHGRRFRQGVRGEFSALFVLMDEGIGATPYAFEPPADGWPRFVIGVRRIFEASGLADGRPYRAVWVDPFDRLALYAHGAGLDR